MRQIPAQHFLQDTLPTTALGIFADIGIYF
jgi:hypothetical protein